MNKMKKISIITIILYMLFVTSVFASTATISVSAARLRKEANTESDVLTKIYEGEKVEILEKNGEWYKVKYGNNVGYLKNNLVKEDSNNSENLNISEGKTTSNNVSENSQQTIEDSSKVVTNSQTKIRYQPNMMSNVIVQIEAGKELTKIAEIGKWIQVSDGTVEGWILENKINENKALAQEDTNENDSNENSTIEKEQSDTENKTNIENKKDAESKKETENEKNTENKKDNESNNNKSQGTSANKKGKVNVETAKVRSKADKSSKVVGFLDYNDEIIITAEEGEWYKFTEKDSAGYVHKTLITLIEDEAISSRGNNEERNQEETIFNDTTTVDNNTNQVISNVLSSSGDFSKNGNSVVELAKKYLGYKYVVGGKNPDSGFDCSGFTRYVFLQFGYSLGTTAAGQNNLGVEIARSDLRPGDLILFYDEGKTKIGHTGIYISDGDFIHSANPKRGVVIDNINTNSYYNERYIIAKRIVE
ncbi:MAG: SH3 domain-containing protein [Clostridia bacterium]|nr:SH3 domain-containing protein [Clostridia bacterium]